MVHIDRNNIYTKHYTSNRKKQRSKEPLRVEIARILGSISNSSLVFPFSCQVAHVNGAQHLELFYGGSIRCNVQNESRTKRQAHSFAFVPTSEILPLSFVLGTYCCLHKKIFKLVYFAKVIF